jgi:Mn2+/Fe2+ NRAMP family transporter
MLAVVQAIAAQVGVVSKRGLEDCVRSQYGRAWGFLALGSLLVVNIITLAADLEGGGAALALLTHISYRWWLVPFAGGMLAVLILGKYKQIERVLRYLALLFLTYFASVILAHPDWHAVLVATFVPRFNLEPATVSGAIALLGTTLTAYAYVWETIEMSEEKPSINRIGLVQVDSTLGIVVAGLTFWAIEITTGATLGVHHHVVQTAQDAAEALVPLAGRFAAIVFGVGLLASAIIAVPVIAATSAYVSAEMFGWRKSLDATFSAAPEFYRLLIGTTVVALGIAFAGVPPIQLLFFSGIAGGIVTPFTLVLMLLIARDRKMMHHRVIPPGLAVAGWAVAAVVTAASGLFLYQTFTGAGGS